MSKEIHPVTFWDRDQLPSNMKDYRPKAVGADMQNLVEKKFVAPLDEAVEAVELAESDLAGTGNTVTVSVTEAVPVTGLAAKGAAPD